jgi:hypothetical protein
VLIARTAKRENVTVVTDNTGDFEKIRNYCAVQIMSGLGIGPKTLKSIRGHIKN